MLGTDKGGKADFLIMKVWSHWIRKGKRNRDGIAATSPADRTLLRVDNVLYITDYQAGTVKLFTKGLSRSDWKAL